jgi:hypothetical protein
MELQKLLQDDTLILQDKFLMGKKQHHCSLKDNSGCYPNIVVAKGEL